MSDNPEGLVTQAKAANKSGDLNAAIAAYLAADSLFAAQGDARGRTRCWSGIAKAQGKNEDFVESAKAFGEMATHARAAGWAEKEIEALYNKGLLLQDMGTKGARLNYVEQAITAFEQGLAVARRAADRQSEGVFLIVAGLACAWCSRHNDSIHYLAIAADFALDGLDFDTSYAALNALAVQLSNKDRAVEAIPYYERALALAKVEDGSLFTVAETYGNLAIAYEKVGRLDKAIEVLEFYYEILNAMGDTKAPDAAAMLRKLKARVKKVG